MYIRVDTERKHCCLSWPYSKNTLDINISLFYTDYYYYYHHYNHRHHHHHVFLHKM